MHDEHEAERDPEHQQPDSQLTLGWRRRKHVHCAISGTVKDEGTPIERPVPARAGYGLLQREVYVAADIAQKEFAPTTDRTIVLQGLA